MLSAWALVRFVHVLGAILWVGGQLTVSALVLPVARRHLDDARRAALMRTLGLRLGIVTLTVFIPLQVSSGILLAWHKGVTIASLGDPGYGRMLAGKLTAFVLVMLAAGLHGWANGAGRRTLARSLAIASLVGSLGVVLLATALPTT